MKDAFKVGSQKFSEDLTEICNDMKNRHVHSFMEFLYEDYVPQGMPQNVATVIKILGGGCSVITLSALIPEFNNEEENETDKENNATTTSEATVNAE